MKPLAFKVIGLSLGISGSVLFSLCILWDLAFPSLAMTEVWKGLLPGFEQLSVSNYLLGLGETFLYGWVAAGIFVPVYNWLHHSLAEKRVGEVKP